MNFLNTWNKNTSLQDRSYWNSNRLHYFCLNKALQNINQTKSIFLNTNETHLSNFLNNQHEIQKMLSQNISSNHAYSQSLHCIDKDYESEFIPNLNNKIWNCDVRWSQDISCLYNKNLASWKQYASNMSWTSFYKKYLNPQSFNSNIK